MILVKLLKKAVVVKYSAETTFDDYWVKLNHD